MWDDKTVLPARVCRCGRDFRRSCEPDHSKSESRPDVFEATADPRTEIGHLRL